MLFASFVLCLVGAVFASETGDLNVEVSLKGVQVKLSKESQLAEWRPLDDKKYNEKGFYEWKSVKDGFSLKNKDGTQLSCHSKSQGSTGKTVSVGFSCNPSEAVLATALIDATSRARFTPITNGHNLQPLDKDVNAVAGGNGDPNRGHSDVRAEFAPIDGNDVDDTAFEGESSNADQNIEEPNAEEMARESKYLAKTDVGPGDLFHDQEAKTQSHAHYHSRIIDKSEREHQDAVHDKLVDTPFVSAGVDREVNDKMYEFFKKHPQYHTPEAHWRAARKWKKILASAREGGSENEGKGLWGGNNKCGDASKVPHGWPDSPHLKCENYAISPMGYWGCLWLFEDGTCGYIQYYKTIRWDGLDSYVTRNHDPEDKELMKQGVDMLQHTH